MRKYFNLVRSTPLEVARAILAATLLLALLSNNFPSSVFASGQMCELACCAGRPPHAAGSCMNGSCHTGLLAGSKPIHIHVRIANQKSDPLCGLIRVTAAGTLKFLQVQGPDAGSFDPSSNAPADSSGSRKSPTEKARVSVTVLTKPCQPDCGAGSFSSSQRRSRDSAATPSLHKPRGPSSLQVKYTADDLAKALDALCERSRPRGPPTFLPDSLT